jgi:hypothetical protein
VLAGLQVVAEIAACRAGEQRKDERRIPHRFPPPASFLRKRESSNDRRLD